MVLWQSDDPDVLDVNVYGRIYGSDHSGEATQFRVNTYTDTYQGTPRVAMASDRSFVAVWESSSQDGSGTGIFAQRFDAEGNPVGDEFQVVTYADAEVWQSRVAMRPDGGFVVVWESLDDTATGIYARIYDASGNALGAEFQVNTTPDRYEQ